VEHGAEVEQIRIEFQLAPLSGEPPQKNTRWLWL
jgi:hypothetical protein